jgi:hypothetical protein
MLGGNKRNNIETPPALIMTKNVKNYLPYLDFRILTNFFLEKRTVKKRGNPYYYPSLNYNFLPEAGKHKVFVKTA